MKKILISIILLILSSIALFFYLQKDISPKEKNKPIEKEPSKQIKVIKKTPVKKVEKEKIKEVKKIEEIKINLDPELAIDRTKIYKNEKYDKPISLENTKDKKEKDLDINFGVDVDKKEKEIDGFKLDIGKKF